MPAAWTLWILAAVLGTYAVPTMALPMVAIGGWLAVSWLLRGERRGLYELVGAGAVAVVLSFLLYRSILDQPGWSFEGPALAEPLDFAGEVWAGMHLQLGRVAEIVAAVGVIAAIALHGRVGRQRISLPLVALVSLPLIWIALPDPPPFPRSWQYLTVIELPALAAAIVALLPDRAAFPRLSALLPVAIAVALAAVVVVGTPPRFDAPFRGSPETARWLEGNRPGSPVAISWITQPPLEMELRFAEASNPLVVGSPAPVPAESNPLPDPDTLLAVAALNGQTPAGVLAEFGLEADEQPAVKPIGSFNGFDLYELGAPVPVGPPRSAIPPAP